MIWFIVVAALSVAALFVLLPVPEPFAEASMNELLRDAAEQNRAAAALVKAGKYREALPHCRKSLEIWESVLGENHPNIVHRLNSLAALHERLGEYAESEVLYRRAVLIREKAFGNNHASVAESLGNLERVVKAQGRDAEAEALRKRAEDILRKNRGQSALSEPLGGKTRTGK